MELILGDCLEKMKDIESGSVDLTVTSPPYDKLRSYNGNNKQWSEDVWKKIISTEPLSMSFIFSKQSPKISSIYF